MLKCCKNGRRCMGIVSQVFNVMFIAFLAVALFLFMNRQKDSLCHRDFLNLYGSCIAKKDCTTDKGYKTDKNFWCICNNDDEIFLAGYGCIPDTGIKKFLYFNGKYKSNFECEGEKKIKMYMPPAELSGKIGRFLCHASSSCSSDNHAEPDKKHNLCKCVYGYKPNTTYQVNTEVTQFCIEDFIQIASDTSKTVRSDKCNSDNYASILVEDDGTRRCKCNDGYKYNTDYDANNPNSKLCVKDLIQIASDTSKTVGSDECIPANHASILVKDGTRQCKCHDEYVYNTDYDLNNPKSHLCVEDLIQMHGSTNSKVKRAHCKKHAKQFEDKGITTCKCNNGYKYNTGYVKDDVNAEVCVEDLIQIASDTSKTVRSDKCTSDNYAYILVDSVGDTRQCKCHDEYVYNTDYDLNNPESHLCVEDLIQMHDSTDSNVKRAHCKDHAEEFEYGGITTCKCNDGFKYNTGYDKDDVNAKVCIEDLIQMHGSTDSYVKRAHCKDHAKQLEDGGITTCKCNDGFKYNTGYVKDDVNAEVCVEDLIRIASDTSKKIRSDKCNSDNHASISNRSDGTTECRCNTNYQYNTQYIHGGTMQLCIMVKGCTGGTIKDPKCIKDKETCKSINGVISTNQQDGSIDCKCAENREWKGEMCNCKIGTAAIFRQCVANKIVIIISVVVTVVVVLILGIGLLCWTKYHKKHSSVETQQNAYAEVNIYGNAQGNIESLYRDIEQPEILK